jgi:nicotinamidase-related amidase
MPKPDLTEILDPARCAVVNMECQENLLGPNAVIPALAQAAAEVGLVETLAGLFESARAAGVRIFYCTDERRTDGLGLAENMPIQQRILDGGASYGGHGPVLAPIAPQPADVVFRREQGVTGFFATGLDQYLRNTDVRTLVVTGVSLNLAVLGTAIEAANRGYSVVVPPDGVAGVPQEYVDAVLRFTVQQIGYTATSQLIRERWSAGPGVRHDRS